MALPFPSQSIKCTDCGKVLRNADFASFHAEKSGHTNFEESTEEVREKLESLTRWAPTDPEPSHMDLRSSL